MPNDLIFFQNSRLSYFTLIKIFYHLVLTASTCTRGLLIKFYICVSVIMLVTEKLFSKIFFGIRLNAFYIVIMFIDVYT